MKEVLISLLLLSEIEYPTLHLIYSIIYIYVVTNLVTDRVSFKTHL